MFFAPGEPMGVTDIEAVPDGSEAIDFPADIIANAIRGFGDRQLGGRAPPPADVVVGAGGGLPELGGQRHAQLPGQNGA